MTNLHHAARDGDCAAITQAIQGGANLNLRNQHGETALMMAIEHIQIRAIEVLLENGASPTLPDGHGNTPLHLAVDIAIEEAKSVFDTVGKVVAARTEPISLLLAWGADPAIRNARGESAFDWARDYEHIGAVRLFEAAQSSVAPDGSPSVAPPGAPSSAPRVNADIGPAPESDDGDDKNGQ